MFCVLSNGKIRNKIFVVSTINLIKWRTISASDTSFKYESPSICYCVMKEVIMKLQIQFTYFIQTHCQWQLFIANLIFRVGSDFW